MIVRMPSLCISCMCIGVTVSVLKHVYFLNFRYQSTRQRQGKPTETPRATAQEFHEDVRRNPDLYEAAQRELSQRDQLANRTALCIILLSNITWYGPKSVPLPKPDFIHGNRKDAPITYVFDFAMFKYTNEAGNEVTLSSRGLYQRTVSIRSKEPAIPPCKEMNLSWVASKPGGPGFFKAHAPFYSIWNDTKSIDILEPGFSWKVSVGMQISQIRPIGLRVLEDDGSGCVGKHGGHGFFHASVDFAR